MQKDIQDVSEKELTKLYAEYLATLGRPVSAVVHRQGRNIPGCVTTEASAAWEIPYRRFRQPPRVGAAPLVPDSVANRPINLVSVRETPRRDAFWVLF